MEAFLNGTFQNFHTCLFSRNNAVQKELHVLILRKGNHLCDGETSIKTTEIEMNK